VVSKEDSVIRLKSNILAPSKFFPHPQIFGLATLLFQNRSMKRFLVSAVFQSASALTTQREPPGTRKGATLQNFKWIVTLENFRSIIKMWFTVN